MNTILLPTELTTRSLEDCAPLSLAWVNGEPILTVVRIDDSPGMILLSELNMPIYPRDGIRAAILNYGRELALVEILSAPTSHNAEPLKFVGSLAVCPDGLALVCGDSDRLGFNRTTLVSLTNGQELPSDNWWHEAPSIVQEWRLVRRSTVAGVPPSVLLTFPIRQDPG